MAPATAQPSEQAPPSSPEDGPIWVVARFGAHPCVALGIDLTGEETEVFRWLLASCLPVSREIGSFKTLFEALDGGGLLAAPPDFEDQGFRPQQALAIESVLLRGGSKRADKTALLLARLAHASAHTTPDGLDAAAARCDDLDSLGRMLIGLAPGFGRGAVLHFLQPLRDRWLAAQDLPLDAKAHAAGAHLGWWDETTEPESATARLRGLCRGEVLLADAEAALARLGAASCARARSTKCPLGNQCPAAE